MRAPAPASSGLLRRGAPLRNEVLHGCLAAALLATLLSIRIGAPWTYIHDDNGAWTQAVAAAHLKAGLGRTRGQDFLLRRADGALVAYLHHPPLYPLVTAATYRVVGRSGPLVTRLVPATFHLLGFLGLALLARALMPGSAARRILALWLFALVPMSSFFGKMPFNESLGSCFVTWGTALAALWLRKLGDAAPSTAPRPGGAPSLTLLGSAACWVLACLSSWPTYPVLAGVGAALVLEARRRPGQPVLRAALLLGATGMASGAMVLAQLAWAGGGDLGGFLRAGRVWGGALVEPSELARQLGVVLDNHRRYFGNVPFALFVAWCVLRIRGWRRDRRLAWEDRLLLFAGAGCALWALAFAKQVALHAYGQFWFLPFETLAAADLAVRMWERLADRPGPRAALAAAALAVTVLSSAWVLAYRYTHPHGYAIRTAAALARDYETPP
ncbi:MAG TPA: hypothetical protein VGK93_00285 [Candidatus Eisenbacteria bacterium]|jgi:hypothetical protein